MTRIMLIIGFLITFSAGLVIGLELRVGGIGDLQAAPPTTRPSGRDSWLTTELGLDSQQQEQLKKIWSETAHRGGREQDDKRRALRSERDKSIAALIPESDREKYDQVMKNYADQSSALDKEWRSSFQAAVEKTKAILTPQQRTKYEEILKRHEAERSSRATGPATRPAENK